MHGFPLRKPFSFEWFKLFTMFMSSGAFAQLVAENKQDHGINIRKMFVLSLNPKQIITYPPSFHWLLRASWSEGFPLPYLFPNICLLPFQPQWFTGSSSIILSRDFDPPHFREVTGFFLDRTQWLSSSWAAEFFHHLTQEKQVLLLIYSGNSSSLSQSESRGLDCGGQ